VCYASCGWIFLALKLFCPAGVTSVWRFRASNQWIIFWRNRFNWFRVSKSLVSHITTVGTSRWRQTLYIRIEQCLLYTAYYFVLCEPVYNIQQFLWYTIARMLKKINLNPFRPKLYSKDTQKKICPCVNKLKFTFSITRWIV